jgi:hypothetical protein
LIGEGIEESDHIEIVDGTVDMCVKWVEQTGIFRACFCSTFHKLEEYDSIYSSF